MNENIEEIKNYDSEREFEDNTEMEIINKLLYIKKEIAVNILDELIKKTELNKIYEFIGDDYIIKIAQNNKFDKNKTNIDLLECENIL